MKKVEWTMQSGKRVVVEFDGNKITQCTIDGVYHAKSYFITPKGCVFSDYTNPQNPEFKGLLLIPENKLAEITAIENAGSFKITESDKEAKSYYETREKINQAMGA